MQIYIIYNFLRINFEMDCLFSEKESDFSTYSSVSIEFHKEISMRCEIWRWNEFAGVFITIRTRKKLQENAVRSRL